MSMWGVGECLSKVVCELRITAEYSAPFERVSLSFSWNIYE